MDKIGVAAIIFAFLIVNVASATNSTKVEVGLYVLNLGKFDLSTGSFTADFYLSLRCDGKCPALDFEFLNGRASSIDKSIDEDDEKFYRIQANLNSPIDLKNFPFDEQRMQIIIEDKKSTFEELEFVPKIDESGIDSSVSFVGWNMKNWSAKADRHEYKIYNETYSRYTFEIPIERVKVNSIFKTFLPISFIILVMLSSFVLDPDKITTRLAMVGSALVASVMFHVSLANQIPPVGYLTFIDKFMIVSYFVILLTFIFNVYLLQLYEQKQEEKVKKLHKYTELTMFVAVPLLYVVLFIFFI